MRSRGVKHDERRGSRLRPVASRSHRVVVSWHLDTRRSVPMKPLRWPLDIPDLFVPPRELSLGPCKRGGENSELHWTADTIPEQFTLSGGQVYRLVGSEQIEARRGATVLILSWTTHCPSCGIAFIVRTGTSCGGKGPVRRCKRCRRPGWSVKNELARKAS